MTKDIERVLQASYIINDCDIDINEEKNTYTVELETIALKDNQDLGELLKLKNKIRSMVNKAYKVTFKLTFTT